MLPAAAAALLLPAPALGARGFSLGVTAGEIGPRSAILWGHADRSGRYVLEVARDRRFRDVVERERVRATRGNDNTVQRKVRRLRPGARYWYRFGRGRRARSDVGSFVTAPRPRQNVNVEFAWTGDTDFNTDVGQTRPFWNNGGVFREMKAERNDFNVHLGDTIYSDSEILSRLFPIALTVPQKWEKYTINLGNRHLRAVRRSAGFYSHWDDHEFVNDFSPAESTFLGMNVDGQLLYRRGLRAFRDYAPVRWSPRDGLYRTVRWGRNLELFFLDERSFRSAKADEGGVCDNPQTGQPDVAPTMPRPVPGDLAAIFPTLAQPVSQACLDTIRSRDRMFLGRRQLRRFLSRVKRSTARFKVIMNEQSIQQHYLLPYDRWEGYEAERQQVLRTLQRVKNVVFLAADEHATLVGDARFQTLESGGPRNSGILEVLVGPAATARYASEIDLITGNRPGPGALVDTAFFEPRPPGGIGLHCSIVDQFSYGQVKVTSRRLTITPKGIAGRPQRNDGRPCGPFVLRYRR
jgi:alkaline phosphatase D